MTITLAIPLDPDHVEAVERLRARLGVDVESPPQILHVSVLVIVEAPRPSELQKAVREVSGRSFGFTLRARDIGVFLDGEGAPVVQVPVVRSSALARLHRALFDAATDAGAVVEGRSRPDAWMPHVTVWRDTVTPELLGRALAQYAAGPAVAWTIPATTLTWLDDDGVVGTERLGGVHCHA